MRSLFQKIISLWLQRIEAFQLIDVCSSPFIYTVTCNNQLWVSICFITLKLYCVISIHNIVVVYTSYQKYCLTIIDYQIKTHNWLLQVLVYIELVVLKVVMLELNDVYFLEKVPLLGTFDNVKLYKELQYHALCNEILCISLFLIIKYSTHNKVSFRDIQW